MKAVLILMTAMCCPNVIAGDVVDLWEGPPPYSKAGSIEETVVENWGVPCVKNITRPTMTIFPAEGENTGRAVVIIPGGGYEVESFVEEGRKIASFLAAEGITAAVLKYRLPQKEISDTPWLLPMTDTQRAVAMMRSLAYSYGVDTSKVGVVGFSAGGHLAATVSVWPSEDPKGTPDFSALVYPAVTLSPENRKWLEKTFFHHAMTEDELKSWDLIGRIDASTPPVLMIHSADDDVVPLSESLLWAQTMIAAGGEVDAHYFATGGHGFGPGRAEDGTDQWLGLLANWVKRQ
jgi:acetyl esterase/lipase